MLDMELKEQLKTYFSDLQSHIDFVVRSSSHTDNDQLIELLTELTTISKKLRIQYDQASPISSVPRFSLFKNGEFTNVSFTGIPGGHEFSSLILAILNADGKGKLPDESIINRVRRLKGTIKLKTYISLSCENCPDVVQSLNLMALFHRDFSHEMIDGAYNQEDIKRLGIQGVPSVVQLDSNQLIHSGKSSFLELLTKLESIYGQDEYSADSKTNDLGIFDVVIVGGGPAGASAAIYSARKGLKTAIVTEKIGGQVLETKGIENLISTIYTEGPQLAAHLTEHIKAYPLIKVLEHRKVQNVVDYRTINTESKLHQLNLEGGEFIKTKAIIVSTGAKWRKLNVPGEDEYIGRGVAFCPHCDGPFYAGKKIAVIGGGNSGIEAAIDLAGIVKEVVVFEFLENLKADKVLIDKLNSLPNTKVITNARTTQFLGDGSKITHIEYEERISKTIKKLELDGIFIQIGLLPNTAFIKELVETNKVGEIVVDSKGRSSVPGIYAAGDVATTPYKQIIIAMGDGAKAALAAYEDQMLG